MPDRFVVSHVQLCSALDARRAGAARVATSLDLGLTSVDLALGEEGIVLPDGATLPWGDVEAIVDEEQHCFAVEEGRPRRLSLYSEDTGRYLSLMPTESAPTLLVSGIAMHRIKDCDPLRDTQAKVRTLRPLTGRVLDTSTGLGYTAIAAARTAEEVLTVEIDPGVIALARENPWSRELFADPRIARVMGDSFELVQGMPDGSFHRILHDPPAMRLSGDLYSTEMYRHLYRLLRRGGRLFHYVGDPQSKSGRNVTRSVMRRLAEVGFRQVRPTPAAFGVTARR